MSHEFMKNKNLPPVVRGIRKNNSIPTNNSTNGKKLYRKNIYLVLDSVDSNKSSFTRLDSIKEHIDVNQNIWITSEGLENIISMEVISELNDDINNDEEVLIYMEEKRSDGTERIGRAKLAKIESTTNPSGSPNLDRTPLELLNCKSEIWFNICEYKNSGLRKDIVYAITDRGMSLSDAKELGTLKLAIIERT